MVVLARRLLVALAILLIVGYVAVWYDIRQGESIRRESQTRRQRIKDDIDARFSAGAAKLRVLAYVNAMFPNSFGGAEYCSGGYNCYLFYLEKVPSGMWYCGPLDVGIEIEFRDDERLTEVRLLSRANNCL